MDYSRDTCRRRLPACHVNTRASASFRLSARRSARTRGFSRSILLRMIYMRSGTASWGGPRDLPFVFCDRHNGPAIFHSTTERWTSRYIAWGGSEGVGIPGCDWEASVIVCDVGDLCVK